MTEGPVSRVQKLISTGRAGGSDVRPALLRVVVDLFVSSRRPDAEEARRFSELSLRLIERADEVTLRAVAKQLASCDFTPPPVLWRLSQCDATICAELLEHSPVMPDDILLTLIKQGDKAKMAAIGRRSTLPDVVAAMLRDKTAPELSTLLAETPQAEASQTYPVVDSPTLAPLAGAAGLTPQIRPQPLDADQALAVSNLVSAWFFSHAHPDRVITIAGDQIRPGRIILSPVARPAAKAASAPTAASPPSAPSEAVAAVSTPAASTAPKAPVAAPAPALPPIVPPPLAPVMVEPLAANTAKPNLSRIITIIERATLQQKPQAIIGAIADGHGLSTSFVARLMQDQSGETTLFLLKALGLGKDVLSKTLITCHPPIAMSVSNVYRLVSLYDSVPAEVVKALKAQWLRRDAMEREGLAYKPPAPSAPQLSAREAASHPPRVTLTPVGFGRKLVQKG